VSFVIYDLPEFSSSHNPKVAGSNPAPATKKFKILNGFRYEFGGHFCFWKKLKQILGKELLAGRRSKLLLCPSHSSALELACDDQMCVFSAACALLHGLGLWMENRN
jgi:hypothetical protein